MRLIPIIMPKPMHAFTLIEVMLAIAIFSIVLVAIHTVFFSAVQLRNTTTAAIEQQIPLDQTLAIMRRDLANIVVPGGTFFGQLQTAVSSSATATTNTLNLLSPVNDAVTGVSGPAFFTMSGSLDDYLPWGQVQRVTYYLTSPTNNTPGRDLIRSVTRNLLPVTTEVPENQRLLSGLQSLAFYYYDGVQWRDYWDSTIETNKLPYGIKVQLQMVPNESSRVRPAPIELVVPIVLRATNQTTQASSGA